MGALLKKLLQLLLKRATRKPPPPPKKPPSSQPPGCTVRCKLPKPARPPARRHDPCKTAGNDPTKEQNPKVDPDVDIGSDLNSLNEGRFLRDGEDYIVGERRYGYHPDTGTVFPKAGRGIVNMDRAQHQLLKTLNSGSLEDAMQFAKHLPGLSDAKVKDVLSLWRKCRK